MRMIVPASALLVSLLAALSASAQSVDDIVARHVEARGGAVKLNAIQSIRITRTVATPFATVRVVIHKKRPQLYRVEQGVKGQPMVPRAVNGTDAWDGSADGKVVLRPPQAAAEARELDGDFDGLLIDWKGKGHLVAFEGKEAITGGEAFTLKVTTRGGIVRYIHLDTTTYLDRRHTGVNSRGENFVMDFSNWRAVDGVTFPFNLDEDRTGPQVTQSFATYTEKVEINVPMADSLFATPAGAAAPRGQ